MGEIFLVNINCSKVLGDNDMSQYAMFIDSSKMSIVYELVEWIRWMFSLETCFYIMYNNSVIHELEDIQLLARLQNFELTPCGRPNCVHEKTYRSLLKSLNLFVSWNGLEVHKYFLHKLNQMDQNLTQEINRSNPKIRNSGPQSFLDYDKKLDNTMNTNPDNRVFFSCENNLSKVNNESMPIVKKSASVSQVEAQGRTHNASSAELNSSFDKKIKSNGNISNSVENFSCVNVISNGDTETSTFETKKRIKANIITTSPLKSTQRTVQESSKNSTKPYSKKYIKPFSLGEILSNMREEIEKQKTELRMKVSSPSPTSFVLKEEGFDEKMAVVENSSVTEMKTSGGRKRQRSRKRRSKKKSVDESISSFLHKNTEDCSFVIPQSSSSLKPNHIRFDSDEDNNLMETEVWKDHVEDNDKIKNQANCEFSEELTESNEFLQNKPEESAPMITDNDGVISEGVDTENEIQCSVPGLFVAEEKLIDFDNQVCDNISGSHNTRFESKTFNPDLNMLLSLKEKFKNAVVIERFY